MALPAFRRSSARRFAIAISAVLWLGFAPLAVAASPDGAADAAARAATTEEWSGRFCTLGGCRSRPASPMGAAASFGVALLAARWLSRRPAPHQPAPGSE